MDDICRSIDKEYAANRKRHANDMEQVKALATTNQIVTQPITMPTKPSLWCRVIRGMKHPLRAAGHVILRINYRIKKFTIKHHLKHYQYEKPIPKAYANYLRKMKPSELFLHVLYAPPNPKIKCARLENSSRVSSSGNIVGCCSVIVPFGNLLRDGELDEIFNSTYARIVKLSSLNRSYCLCDLSRWCKGYCSKAEILPVKQWQTQTSPKQIELTFEKSCNLCCRQCRTKPYVMNQLEQQQVNVIVAKLLRSGWLEQSDKLVLAGSGEVFYSPYYRRLLITDLRRQQIEILSNGTLFNEDNWRLLSGKYTNIDVSISVDAATAETYQKLRGADFDNLMKNLTMLADLRRQKKIRWYRLNFVIQRENFREMPDFVRLGQRLGVDTIQFRRLSDWGTFTPQEFRHQCLIVDNKYLDYDLWCVLQNPIFNDPIVGLEGLRRYIDASEKRYRQRYAREQRQGGK